MKTPIATLTAGTLLAGLSAQGSTIYYESFDYEAGTNLSTLTSSVWSGSGDIATPGLTYGDLDSSSSTNAGFVDGNSASDAVDFSGFLDNGDTLWFSVVVNLGGISTNPDFGFALSSSGGSGSNLLPIGASETALGFRIKGNDGGLKAAEWANTITTSGTTGNVGLSAGTTYLVVGEMTFGATDTINLYLPDVNLNLGSVVSTKTVTLDQTAFDTITFMAKGATPGDLVDEIRFGTTSADVLPVPEPGSLALLGLGGLMMIKRRR